MIDVHQHLWPEAFVDRLRARSEPPYLDGWTLHTATEAPYDVDPAAHEIDKRVAIEQDEGTTLAVVSLSSPLGVEYLGDAELLAAWHDGAAEFPEPFKAWASVNLLEPDLPALESLLDKGFLGLQLPAHALGEPAAWEAQGELLRTAERLGKPILVHPGSARSTDGPCWWAPVVDYTSQLQAAWWAWHAFGGRRSYPKLRLCFAAAAGLAPVHHERLSARGGRLGTIDTNLYVDTSSYGPQGIDAVARILGIDQVVHGTDRPYAGSTDLRQGDAATAVIRHDNPHRLLFGTGVPTPERGVQ
ncbi:amidohydrolase family protein [Kribbella kalugense]|uniref:Putative TIM-barrel fold metal-dependent hydrolase n=1 Tax=Kribbella kalugense TaxID=2512221 RepID=A0A4R7ZJ65_9ACTN|nr:amidohydrolase family protein [Kribbella kalugense]TDW17797.1 putative TIM-barrel fold metal-dependent hydrolase [Kribbella kalugense]